MSLATIARPSRVTAPETAKLLLPLGRSAATGGPPMPLSRIAGEREAIRRADGGVRAAVRDHFTSSPAGPASRTRPHAPGQGSPASPLPPPPPPSPHTLPP